MPVDRALVEPTWSATPSDWTVREGSAGETAPRDTGWLVTRAAAGLRQDHGRLPHACAASRTRSRTSCFPTGWSRSACSSSRVRRRRTHVGFSQQGGLNVYSLQLDDNLVTALGEVPGATVRQIASSVTRR